MARLNPAGSEVVVDVPHLRIIDDDLWDAVKRRQAEVARPLTDPHVTTPLNDLHRPRFLLSGLLTCGVCGGGYRSGPRIATAAPAAAARAPAPTAAASIGRNSSGGSWTA